MSWPLRGGAGIGPPPGGAISAMLFVCLLGLTSCDGLPIGGGSQGEARHANGPLGTGGEGGASVDPPGRGFRTYVATFGPLNLCSTTAAVPVLDRVTFGPEAPPGTYAVVRSVDREPAERARPRDRPDLAGLLFGLGSPPRFSEPYAGAPSPGHYTSTLSGFRVEHSCTEHNEAVVALNKHLVPDNGIDDLLIVVPSTSAGAEVEGFNVEYEVNGEPYSLDVPWSMVVCDRRGRLPYCTRG